MLFMIKTVVLKFLFKVVSVPHAGIDNLGNRHCVYDNTKSHSYPRHDRQHHSATILDNDESPVAIGVMYGDWILWP